MAIERANGTGGEKPGEFFASYGAPCEAFAGEKPAGFFASTSEDGERDDPELSRVPLRQGERDNPELLQVPLREGERDNSELLQVPLRGALSPNQVSIQKKGNKTTVTVRTGPTSEAVAIVPTGDTVAVDKGGRPTVMKEELKSQVCLLLSVGMSRRQAAAYLDIVHGTIANAMQREPEFAERVQRAEELAIAKPLVQIAAAGQKNWRAAAWLLTRNEKRRAQTAEEMEEKHEREMQLSRNAANELMEIGKVLSERQHEIDKANWERRL